MVTYPNLQSAMRPVPQSEQLLVLKPPNNVTMDKENSAAEEVHPDQVGEGTDSDSTPVHPQKLFHNSSTY